MSCRTQRIVPFKYDDVGRLTPALAHGNTINKYSTQLHNRRNHNTWSYRTIWRDVPYFEVCKYKTVSCSVFWSVWGCKNKLFTTTGYRLQQAWSHHISLLTIACYWDTSVYYSWIIFSFYFLLLHKKWWFQFYFTCLNSKFLHIYQKIPNLMFKFV
jgi:hypothetical protein